MPEPLAICIEDLRVPAGASRYLCCVVVPGRQPGLRLDDRGRVHWKRDEPVAAELWVSADDRLILYRPQTTHAVSVSRGGRSIEAPPDKPVVLLTDDDLHVGGRHLRVHIHGPAPAVIPPAPLVESTVRKQAGRVAAVVAIGAAVAGCKDIEVRDSPPQVPADPDTTAPLHPTVTAASAAATASATAEVAAGGAAPATTSTGTATATPPTTTASPPPIEVRERPPAPPQNPNRKP